MPQVDVTCERVDFLAVDQDLHARDGRQVHGQRVDDGVDREDLVERAAAGACAMTSPDRSTNASPRSVTNTSRSFVSAGIAETQRRRGRELRLDDGARLLGHAVAPNGTSRCAGTSVIPSSLT